MTEYEAYVIDFGMHRGTKLIDMVSEAQLQYISWYLEQPRPDSEKLRLPYTAFKWWQGEHEPHVIAIDSLSLFKGSEARRQYIKSLKWQIQQLEKQCAAVQLAHKDLLAAWNWEYPKIPPPITPFKRSRCNRNTHWNVHTEVSVPACSGVYFAWKDEAVAYVGQSINLRRRCVDDLHENIHNGDFLSWLLFAPHELNHAEAFYIGIAKPWRNFGSKRRTADICLLQVA